MSINIQTAQGLMEIGGEVTKEKITEALGGSPLIITIDNHTLIEKDGKLIVNTATTVQQDNTLPITSAAVYREIGNIESLLSTI